MNLFFDTSAFVKLYHEESGSEKITDFLFSHSKDLIITISDLTKIEFHSTFLKYVRTGEIKYPIINDIFNILDEDLKMINIIVVDNQIKKFAIELLFCFLWFSLVIPIVIPKIKRDEKDDNCRSYRKRDRKVFPKGISGIPTLVCRFRRKMPGWDAQIEADAASGHPGSLMRLLSMTSY